jgi:hypothetical protein
MEALYGHLQEIQPHMKLQKVRGLVVWFARLRWVLTPYRYSQPNAQSRAKIGLEIAHPFNGNMKICIKKGTFRVGGTRGHPIIPLSRENLLKEKSIDRKPAFLG